MVVYQGEEGKEEMTNALRIMSTTPRVKGDSRGYLYRYVDTRIAILGSYEYDCDEVVGHYMEVDCHKYRIIKRTPKGAWIETPWSAQEKKFILLTARKQFACNGKTLALRSYMARKRKQIRIYEGRVKDAKEALAIASRMSNG